jgi:hypothetical protein
MRHLGTGVRGAFALGLPQPLVGPKGGVCFHGARHFTKRGKEPDHSPKCLYISIDVAVSFETPTSNELPLSISMGGILYNAIQGTGQAFAKTIHLRMGVFSVAPIRPLPGADTAYCFFAKGHPYPSAMAKAYPGWFGQA